MTERRARGRTAGSVRPRERRSLCPIACTLDIVGDRWTLVVVRDLFSGKTRYGEFLASPEGIPTNILADRLRRLAQAGLVETAPYREHPPRLEYRLSPAGRDLGRIIEAFSNWGLAHIPGTRRLLGPQRAGNAPL